MKHLRQLILALFVFLTLVMNALPVQAVQIKVNTPDDIYDPDDKKLCSLREAIIS
ncbi:MAG: hypothetical protein DRQ62_03440, partial [Gammaproteobacteria bacterium]